MAVKKHGVHFDITAENATDRALRAVEENLNGINKAAAAVGRVLQGAFIATAAISAGKAFANAAIEAEQASKRLDAVLKATGGSAGLTKKQLDAMADAMAESTQFDDESLRNAQAQMLKFGNIHGETFGAAMKLSADLAAFMGTDLNSAVQSVGKALTSPVEGVTALERQVGRFNPATKEMIKNLVESGQEAKAQAVVLETLTGKIGGAAEALNSGLSKAADDAKKQWNEMLEAIGKTEAFQKAGKSGLNFIEQSFRDIKEIVENGDWVEKTLAIMAFAGGWRGMKLSPPEAPAVNEVKGRIRGLPSATVMDAELTGLPMSERDVKAWKEMIAFEEKAVEEAKKRSAEELKEAVFRAEKEVELNELAAADSREAWGFYTEGRIEQEAQVKAARAAGMRAWFDEIDAEQERAIAGGEEMLAAEEAHRQAMKDTQSAARDLGLTMTSAFEKAILDGEELRGVMQGLARDMLQIAMRKTVTEPMANSLTGLINTGLAGFSTGSKGAGAEAGFLSSADFTAGFADGGYIAPGKWGMTGEEGPEPIFGGRTGVTVVPNDAGGGVTIHQTINLSAGVSATVRAEVMSMLPQIQAATVNAVAEERRRGGSFSRAFRG